MQYSRHVGLGVLSKPRKPEGPAAFPGNGSAPGFQGVPCHARGRLLPGGLSRWQMGQHLLRSGGRDTHNGLSLFWAIRPGLGQQRRLSTGKRLITMEETRSFSAGSEAREHQWRSWRRHPDWPVVLTGLRTTDHQGKLMNSCRAFPRRASAPTRAPEFPGPRECSRGLFTRQEASFSSKAINELTILCLMLPS